MGECIHCGKYAGIFSTEHYECRVRKEAEVIANKAKSFIALKNQIKSIVEKYFLVEACSRCNENEMLLKELSPKGKSIKYTCCYCKKVNHASVTNKDAELLIVDKWNEYKNGELRKEISSLKYSEFSFDWDSPPSVDKIKPTDVLADIDFEIIFSAPEAIMLYEKTKREFIKEQVRAEVWRRDLGMCRVCNSRQNLQFDHIIPVSKGGATTASNLQILCRACNQKKGAKI